MMRPRSTRVQAWLPWEVCVTSPDLIAVKRLAKLLAMITEDARQLVDSGASIEQLQHEVELTAAVSRQLVRVLGLNDVESLRLKRASAMAGAVICKAQST